MTKGHSLCFACAEDDSRVDTVFPHVVNLLIMLAHEKRFGAKSEQYARVGEVSLRPPCVFEKVSRWKASPRLVQEVGRERAGVSGREKV